MIFRRRKGTVKGEEDIEELITTHLSKLRKEHILHEYLKKAAETYEASGDPSQLLIYLGRMLHQDLDIGLNTIARFVFTKKNMVTYTHAWRGVSALSLEIIGLKEIISRGLQLGLEVSGPPLVELLERVGCSDLSSVLTLFKILPPPKELLFELVKASLQKKNCEIAMKETLKLLGESVIYGTVDVDELSEVLKGTNLRALVTKTAGKVTGVSIFLGNKLIIEVSEESLYKIPAFDLINPLET